MEVYKSNKTGWFKLPNCTLTIVQMPCTHSDLFDFGKLTVLSFTQTKLLYFMLTTCIIEHVSHVSKLIIVVLTHFTDRNVFSNFLSLTLLVFRPKKISANLLWLIGVFYKDKF